MYRSRQFDVSVDPEATYPSVLGDFGAAAYGEEANGGTQAQPAAYRAPEVMMRADWSYPVDIWNVGVLVSFIIGFVSLIPFKPILHP